MGLLYSLGLRLVNFLVFFFIIVLLPGIPPKTTFPFEAFTITPAKELKGALELNNLLDNAERLFEDKLYGPENLLVKGNDIYTSIHGGDVIKISGNHITHVAKFGKPCGASFEEETCGRPLGLAFDTQGPNLIVADAYYGIWQVDLSNGNKKLLLSPDTIYDGREINRRAKMFNSVAVAKNGDIFWTDSSSDFGMLDGVFSLFANPSGRLFHYSRSTMINTCLIDELYFANGVALHPTEEFVLVSETGAAQIRRFYLKGLKKGQEDIFIDGLPGNTDNLVADAEGIWAPLVLAIDDENPSMLHATSKVPLIRKFLIRMLAIAESPFKLINHIFPTSFTQRIVHAIGHFESMSFTFPDRTTVVRLDWLGNIVGSLHGFDKSVTSVSHVAELGDYLYLGSPYNKYLARVKLPKSPKIKVKNVHFEAAKPEETTTTQKPATTTTTPRPTTTTTTTPKPTTTTPKPTTTTPKPAPTTTTTPKPAPTTTTTPKPAPTTTTTPKPATTTTTTPKPAPTTTTTPKPATTTTTTPKPATTTTPKPATTTTTTPKPATTTTTTPKPTTQKPAATAPPPPAPTTTPPPTPKKSSTAKPTTPETPKVPAPVHEKIPKDTPKPDAPKLKVIKKDGEHVEL